MQPAHQSLTQIKSLLAAHGVNPRHRWGQNFLIDAGKLDLIMGAAEPRAGEMVLEVGPGTGALTQLLLHAGAQVLAVEIDPAMVAILRDRFGVDDPPRWRLLHGDALASKHALSAELAGALPEAGEPFKMVANLPYNIASPLLVVLATDHPNLSGATVMIQSEVADRVLAGPGSKAYGPLTVILAALYEARRVTTLPPECFWPRPKVASAVVQLTRRDRPLTDDPKRLAALLHTLFSKRRKQIGTILGRETALPSGIEPTQRPEELSVERLCEVAVVIG